MLELLARLINFDWMITIDLFIFKESVASVSDWGVLKYVNCCEIIKIKYLSAILLFFLL